MANRIDWFDLIDTAALARRWLRGEVSKETRDPLGGMLAEIEILSAPYYLGLDYDADTSDVDEVGPF